MYVLALALALAAGAEPPALAPPRLGAEADTLGAFPVRPRQAVTLTPAAVRAVRSHAGLRGALAVGDGRVRPRSGLAFYARPGTGAVLLAEGDGSRPLIASLALAEAAAPTLVWLRGPDLPPLRLDLTTGLVSP